MCALALALALARALRAYRALGVSLRTRHQKSNCAWRKSELRRATAEPTRSTVSIHAASASSSSSSAVSLLAATGAGASSTTAEARSHWKGNTAWLHSPWSKRVSFPWRRRKCQSAHCPCVQGRSVPESLSSQSPSKVKALQRQHTKGNVLQALTTLLMAVLLSGGTSGRRGAAEGHEGGR